MINLYHRNTNNIGDLSCSPARYFGIDCVEDDLSEYMQYVEQDIIFGGGMLLKKMGKWKVLSQVQGLKIGWGIGHARYRQGDGPFDYSKTPFLKQFDLLGVRDFGIGLKYVPCPSCMSVLFDKTYEMTRPVVFYENSEAKPLLGSPRFGNEAQSMQEVLEFLGSAELIVTSSYHGVYWSMLLGRKVIAVPFNSKFYTFRHDIPKCELKDWRSKRKEAAIYSGFLEESRELNRRFHERVLNYCGDNKR